MASVRGAQSINTMYFKPMLRKASYHKKSGSHDMMKSKPKEEEINSKGAATTGGDGGDDATTWWIRDDRTGIYYPKGQNKVIQDIPPETAKNLETINWFN